MGDPNSAEKMEHGSIYWLAQNQSPVCVYADYTGIYSREYTVSAKHSVGD